MSLNGKTPAEVSGIDLELKENKWLSLIKQSVEDKETPKITMPQTLTIESRLTSDLL